MDSVLPVHFAEHLKSVRATTGAFGTGRESLPGRIDQPDVEVAAIGIRDGSKQKAENRSQQYQYRQRSEIVRAADPQPFSPARKHPVWQ